LAIQSLRRAIAIDATHSGVYAGILHLALDTAQLPADMNETVAKILREQVTSFLRNTSPSDFLASLVSSHPTSLPHLTVVAQLTVRVQPEKTREALTKLLVLPAGATLHDAVDARAALEAHGTKEDAEKFTQVAHERFRFANAFAPPAPPAPAEITPPTEN
jgi:hypothetical protein